MRICVCGVQKQCGCHLKALFAAADVAANAFTAISQRGAFSLDYVYIVQVLLQLRLAYNEAYIGASSMYITHFILAMRACRASTNAR